ncbi:hypothetical protein [Herbiconiux sp. VKM Ac-2851]|uniref:hypothetical protein n=1 Tax=Herbiconiux sp. VKM Ac-2851 TaxID=2739025 RepID=UPI0015664BA3|nr:hypothetical protein [Herbiconiux sp. VKM Ac-2851]NQX35538.1 hypothetical protein [Herbiconiux sp. VKM Ac-2851]
MSSDGVSVARDAGRSAAVSRRRRVLGVVAAFAALFLVMWVPPAFGFDGWLWLYPFFLAAWIPIEILAVVELAGAVRAAIMSDAGRRTSVIIALIAGVVALLSLPILWFGAFVS